MNPERIHTSGILMRLPTPLVVILILSTTLLTGCVQHTPSGPATIPLLTTPHQNITLTIADLPDSFNRTTADFNASKDTGYSITQASIVTFTNTTNLRITQQLFTHASTDSAQNYYHILSTTYTQLYHATPLPAYNDTIGNHTSLYTAHSPEQPDPHIYEILGFMRDRNVNVILEVEYTNTTSVTLAANQTIQYLQILYNRMQNN